MKQSAGILAYQWKERLLKVFLVHPGGPFWKHKDAGAWTIPKGEFTAEDPLQAAIREFQEETGISISGEFLELAPIKQKSGKVVHAWAVEAALELTHMYSNTFPLEWPPRSGKFVQTPEVDQWEWFTIEEAQVKIIPAQVAFIEDLIIKLRALQ